jgi:plastocyanin
MRILLASLALLALAFAGCSDSGSPASGSSDTRSTSGMDGGSMAPMTAEVMMMNSRFDPADVTIKAGGSVHWVDHDSANRHNVVSSSEGNAFRSPDMDATLPLHEREYTHTFTTVGTVDYLCEYHGGMTGTIHVVA